jgi:cell division septum initiation protein DivIVA
MGKQHHRKRVNYDQRLRQLEDENRKLRESNTSLRQEVDELKSAKDSLSRRVDELELANEELTSKNQELSATLEQYASATASRKPTFSLNYSSDRNNLDSLSSVQSRRCPKRSKNSRRRGRKPHADKPARNCLFKF